MLSGVCSLLHADLLNELEDFLKNISAKETWAWIKNNWPYALAVLGGLIVIAWGLVVSTSRPLPAELVLRRGR
jgi:hypothetical protein